MEVDVQGLHVGEGRDIRLLKEVSEGAGRERRMVCGAAAFLISGGPPGRVIGLASLAIAKLNLADQQQRYNCSYKNCSYETAPEKVASNILYP